MVENPENLERPNLNPFSSYLQVNFDKLICDYI